MEKFIFSKKIFFVIFAFSFLIFLFHTYYTKSAIFADGKFYYAITRSLVKDFDINFENDFPLLGLAPNKTVTGYVWNKYPPGSSMAWTPLFFTIDSLSQILENIGISVDTDGFGIYYQSSVALSSISLGVFALILIHKLLSEYFSEKVATLTILTMFLTTNLLFYIAVEPINSHAVSFFTSTLFVFYFLKHNEDKYYYFVLGLIGGFAGLVRTQDILILIIPTLNILLKHKTRFKTLATCYFLLATGFIFGFLPQIYFWKKIFGTFWYSPYLNEGFSFSPIEILDTLFNRMNGLFYITPAIGISLIGLLLMWKENNSKSNNLTSIGIIYFLFQLLLVTFWSPSIGGSFSNRMMITTLPLLSFGFAKIIEMIYKKTNLKFTLFLVAIFGFSNALQIIKYLLLY
ncbi:glycosyltransferase family 39 protein [Candidatus Woesebacteria bacterium]|nr:glycosyltransferase family 39 protein [Candidatus Woesebacteria bacterium]